MNVVTPNGGDSVADRSWPGLLNPLLRGENLSSEETAWAMDRIMSGEATDAQIAGFAVALRAKGETVDEVTGLVRAMYAHANTIQVPGRTVDIVGTGGDLAKTVNISTMSAIVIAGTGAKVVKHGNRAASSASGSSDVLEKLGVNLELTPQRVVEVAEQAGITFCFAVKFHPALRYAAKARKELGAQTTFNILGPLTNPAQVRAQAVGVADARMAPIVAGVLAVLGQLGPGLPRRRRPRRADHHRHLPGLGGARRRGPRGGLRPARRRADRRPRRGAARRRRLVQRLCGPCGCWTARAARYGRRCCSTRRRPWSPWTRAPAR